MSELEGHQGHLGCHLQVLPGDLESSSHWKRAGSGGSWCPHLPPRALLAGPLMVGCTSQVLLAEPVVTLPGTGPPRLPGAQGASHKEASPRELQREPPHPRLQPLAAGAHQTRSAPGSQGLWVWDPAQAPGVDGIQSGHRPVQGYVARQCMVSGLLPGLLLHPNLPAEVLQARGVAVWGSGPQAGTPGGQRGRQATPAQHPVPSGCEHSWTHRIAVTVVICPGTKPGLLPRVPLPWKP